MEDALNEDGDPLRGYVYSNDENARQGYPYDYTHHPYRQSTSHQDEKSWIDSGPNFAFVVAILVIVFFQFQAPIARLFRRATAREEEHYVEEYEYDKSLWETVSDFYWTLLDYIRAYGQMGWELVRSSVGWLGTLSAVMIEDPFVVDDDDSQVDDNGSPRRGLARTTASRIGRRIRNRRQGGGAVSNGMPDLEPMYDEMHSGTNVMQSTTRQQQQQCPRELEPAFLNESDYPEGWMVYHSVLGVVTKEVADTYDRGVQREGETTPEVLEEEDEARDTPTSTASVVGSKEENVAPSRSPVFSGDEVQNTRKDSVPSSSEISVALTRSIAASG